MSDNDNTLEQNFNDAELQDIMNEIESLEKEFVEQEASEESSAQSDEDNVQAQQSETVEAEQEQELYDEPTHEAQTQVEAATEEYTETPEMEESFEEEEQSDNVVSMENHRPETTTPSYDSSSAGEMTFSGQGQMDFNMSFTLGEKQATLSVESGKLKVSVSGVELYLSEEGCEVEMAGGVRFSVPLDGAANSAGKKAA